MNNARNGNKLFFKMNFLILIIITFIKNYIIKIIILNCSYKKSNSNDDDVASNMLLMIYDYLKSIDSSKIFHRSHL